MEFRAINSAYEDLGKQKNELYISAWQQGKTGIPLVDASKGAWQYVESLSKEDFPESALIFNEKHVDIFNSNFINNICIFS